MHQRAYSPVIWRTILALFAMTAPATANFDLWLINEIYSNADGSIQFIELFTTLNDQEKLNGHVITSLQNPFLFETDLFTFETANRFFLVGTVSYAAAPGAVAPDYMVPDNFFSVDANTITYAGVDLVTFPAGGLPLDGMLSIDRNLLTSPNSPTNFAAEGGQLLVTPEPSTVLLLAFGLAALAVGRNYYRA